MSRIQCEKKNIYINNLCLDYNINKKKKRKRRRKGSSYNVHEGTAEKLRGSLREKEKKTMKKKKKRTKGKNGFDLISSLYFFCTITEAKLKTIFLIYFLNSYKSKWRGSYQKRESRFKRHGVHAPPGP
ncbi:hypothetical protein V8G54_002732, partial [Vigna mungo]